MVHCQQSYECCQTWFQLKFCQISPHTHPGTHFGPWKTMAQSFVLRHVATLDEIERKHDVQASNPCEFVAVIAQRRRSKSHQATNSEEMGVIGAGMKLYAGAPIARTHHWYTLLMICEGCTTTVSVANCPSVVLNWTIGFLILEVETFFMGIHPWSPYESKCLVRCWQVLLISQGWQLRRKSHSHRSRQQPLFPLHLE